MARRELVVRGVVQSVGFRPFVAGLARRFGLAGMVRNDGGSVHVEVEGPEAALAAFADALVSHPPPLATIDAVAVRDIPPLGDTAFTVVASAGTTGLRASVPPDVATCDACLAELADPRDRRFRYPFLNCTHCGPRFTIMQSTPYDRAMTTMRGFPMCDACRREYLDPENRRFHAEPTACPACGPRVWFERPGAPRVERDDAIAAARIALDAGLIVAVKGIGGFHLACRADSDAAVSSLRARKGRGEKPFALMAPSLEAAAELCIVDAEEAALLQDRARPIVLLRRRQAPTAPAVSAQVAPGQDQLGVMLPYSPLHHLLVVDRPLVMTSGNRSDEPIARDNDEARTRLAALADAFLFHDRDIHAVCDDSVIRVVRSAPLPIRRSRGYAPYPVRLPFELPPLLAVGGELKATFCLAEGRDAYLSQHLGDMETVETLAAFERAVESLSALVGIRPALVVFDPHPGYLSTRWAAAWAQTRAIPAMPIQHHRAHHASAMAEHGLDAGAEVIGLVLDGAGYGTDGSIWGGEVFAGGYVEPTRVARLAPAPLPASDGDTRRGYRLALAHLAAAGIAWDETSPAVAACSPTERDVLRQRFTRGVAMVRSSSMGRLFDAVASLTGVRHRSEYEAQAAMALETAAASAAPARDEDAARYAFELTEAGGLIEMSPAPLLRAIVDDVGAGVPPPIVAQRFHAAIAALMADVARRVRARTRLDTVVCSGGVFQNVRLLGLVVDLLERDGFRVLTHRRVPPNDGGLSLGQAVAGGLRSRGAQEEAGTAWAVRGSAAEAPNRRASSE